MDKEKKSETASGGEHEAGSAKELRILSIGAHPAGVFDQTGTLSLISLFCGLKGLKSNIKNYRTFGMVISSCPAR